MIKLLRTHLSGGEVSIACVEIKGVRTVRIPAITLRDDIDSEHLATILQKAYLFLTDECELEDLD
jgi:hypothetical protein